MALDLNLLLCLVDDFMRGIMVLYDDFNTQQYSFLVLQ
jgi:hypothetical protein